MYLCIIQPVPSNLYPTFLYKFLTKSEFNNKIVNNIRYLPSETSAPKTVEPEFPRLSIFEVILTFLVF